MNLIWELFKLGILLFRLSSARHQTKICLLSLDLHKHVVQQFWSLSCLSNNENAYVLSFEIYVTGEKLDIELLIS